MSFTPKVQFLPVGTELKFRNRDEDVHNIHARLQGHTIFNLPSVPSGVERQVSVRLDRPGVVAINCDMHNMTAYIIVNDTKHWAVSDADGRYTLRDVAPGHYVVHAFRPGMDDEVRLREIDVINDMELWLVLPDKKAPLPAPKPFEPDPAKRAWWSDHRLPETWPTGRPFVISAILVALLLGCAISMGISRSFHLRGWSVAASMGVALTLSLLFGSTVLLGLHPAVAIALGIGTVGGAVGGGANRLA
jgi:hypothetical protein